MFKFSTNTVVNNGENVKVVLSKDGSTPEAIRVNRNTLKLANIVGIYRNPHVDDVKFQVTVDLSKLYETTGEGQNATTTPKSKVGRIYLYIKLSDSQNSYYSNDFVFKGKPFYIEFPVKNSATNTATEAVKVVKKYLNMVYEYPLVKVTANGSNLVLEGTDEYQIVSECKLQYYDDTAKSYDCCDVFGDYIDIEDAVTVNRQGNPGFGTYRYMIKNLRLPTAANTRWNRIVTDETPIYGAKYNQYIIKYCTNRGIMGSDAVGEVTKSLTNHVFYVEDGYDNTASTGFKAFISGLTLPENAEVKELGDPSNSQGEEGQRTWDDL